MTQLFAELMAQAEDDNLTIIDYSEKYECILAQDKKTARAHLIYYPPVSHEISFDFDLISHVYTGYQKVFEMLLTSNNLKLELIDTKGDFYEKIVPAIVPVS